MTRSDVSLLAVRLLALYLITMGISYLPGLKTLEYVSDAGSMTRAALFAYAATMVLPLCLGILALAWSRPIARWVTPRAAADEQEDSPRAGLADIQSLAIATFGLLLLAVTLPHLIRAIGLHRSSGRVDSEFFSHFDDWNLVAQAATVVLALLLCIGAGFWTHLLRRFRNLGWESEK